MEYQAHGIHTLKFSYSINVLLTVVLGVKQNESHISTQIACVCTGADPGAAGAVRAGA